VLEAFDSDIEWNEPGGGRAPGGTFNGPESVAADVFSAVPENFEEFSAEPDEWIDARDHLVVTGHFRGAAKDGQAIDVRFAHVWTMRDVSASSFQNLVDQQAWTQPWGG
jgi:ketosteroid isomerase-like protein